MARKELSNEQIGTLIDRKIHSAIGVAASNLSKERERVLKYYDGALPKPQHAGQSTYVSNDVYDSVEAMKADLLETFGGSQDNVKFTAQGPDDVEACRIATEYVSYIFYRRNNGWKVLHDLVDDGLKARVGVVKAYWDEDKEYDDEEFEGLDEQTVQALVAQDDVEELEAEHQGDGTFAGTLSRVKADRSGVKVENVPPEEFIVEPQAKCLQGYFHGQRTLLTKDELRRMGIDTKPLKGVAPDGGEIAEQDNETQTRFDRIGSGYHQNDDRDDEDAKYIVYEVYDTFTKKKGDRPRLHKVVMAGGKVLLCEEVDRTPFKVFVPLRMAHSFWGTNFAQRVIPTQNARTVLTRGILDHTSITNNPRYTVLQGGLTNPREMLDGRLGGLVNISRPDAVKPLEQSPLNPFVFQTLEMLKQNKEETTGTSSLSQGLNKDAISTQNSQGLVEDLVDLSKQRAKVIARNLADFLQELWFEIYNLVIENDTRESVFEVAGNWVEIDPKTWIERKDATVTFHLGKGAADAEALSLAQLLTMATADPDLSRMIHAKKKYNIATHILRLKGHKNHQDFIENPDDLPPPQPDPQLQLQLQEMQLRNRELEVKVQLAEMKVREAEMKAQIAILQAQVEAQKLPLEQELAIADSHRKDLQVANEIDVSQRELDIVEKAPQVEPAKAIVSPNS
ncbi:hypothetical protein GGR34_000739 [Microvirga flocculans]|uniref:Portal protein n=1 Tax=Microvirga flocculans TaxID=217168 RepID=A0A7W6IE07_9HYPH|nr:hypothetical protein [Microvirga flocculans]MBB4039104.1 hypothetical protein [Microvirga flocculans]